jgi:DNA gyrase subunit A
MIALVNGEPKLLGLKEILEHYIKHQENVVRRRTEYDLEKTRARVHILEGLKVAIDNIDEVIKTIRASASVAEARDALVARFSLTQIQAQAIVDMTLGKLSGLERIKIEEELAAKLALINELEEVLANESKLLEIISNELLEIKEKFADGRRTEIAGAIDDIIDEDLIEKEECVVTITRDGYIKRSSASVYSAQRRGGKGIRGMKTKEEDFVDDIIVVHSHSYLLMFTDSGKVFMKKVYQIPEASNISKGTNLVNLINLEKGEKVTSVIAIKSFEDNEYFVMVTNQGVVKRANVKDFEFQRKGGKIAMNLDEGDKLEFVKHTTGDNDIVIATRDGKAVRFQEKEARVMGRTARGVRGIKLKGDDYVVGVAVVDEEKMLITVTEKGYGKRNGFDGYTAHSRGTTGVLCHKLTEKTGKLAGIATVSEDDDIMIITNEGILIRMPVSEVNVYDGNSTVGVRVMRMNENAVIVNFAATKSEDKEEEEIKAAIEESEKESASALDGSMASSVVDEDEI